MSEVTKAQPSHLPADQKPHIVSGTSVVAIDVAVEVVYVVEEVPYLYHQCVLWFLCGNIILPDIPQNQQYTPGFKETVQ